MTDSHLHPHEVTGKDAAAAQREEAIAGQGHGNLSESRAGHGHGWLAGKRVFSLFLMEDVGRNVAWAEMLGILDQIKVRVVN